MHTKLYHIIFLLSLCCSLHSCSGQETTTAQNDERYSWIQPDTYRSELYHGKIKITRTFTYDHYVDKLGHKDKFGDYFQLLKNFEGNGIVKFDEDQKFLWGSKLKDSIHYIPNDTIQKDYIWGYEYDSLSHQQVRPLYASYNLIPQVNTPYSINLTRIRYNIYRVKSLKNHDYRNVSRSYNYTLNAIDSSKIEEEWRHTNFDDDRDGIIDESEVDQHNFYSYDNKGRLIEKRFTFPNYDTIRGDIIERSCLDERCSFEIPKYYKNKQIFTYDDNDQLLDYTLITKNRPLYRETYTYDEQGHIQTKDRYWPRWGAERFPYWHINDRFYYNKQGFISKKQGLDKEDKSVLYTLNFEYTYDDKGNWIERRAYLEGDTLMDGAPLLTTERIIEYYKEE